MEAKFPRRGFLSTASALGMGVGLAPFETLRAITPARADDLVVQPEMVRFRPEIEPVVRWIEEAPRERALEVAIAQLRAGLSYRDLMAGLFLAGIRNVKPRPVGFKFHAVLVINSAHLLGQSASDEDRLLPMLWALDNFKNSQAQDVKEGDWTLGKVDEAHLPSPTQARAAFVKAMDEWDSDAADAATASLCRAAGAAEVMEAFWRYAVRDHRDIGHKAIFSMQCWRALQAIGWEHAEPVLRSLAFGLLDLQNDSKRAPIGPFVENLDRAKRVRDGWTAGKPDAGATRALLATLREATPDAASAKALEQLNAGVAPSSLWDAVILAGNELLVNAPGIIPLHAVTAANALHYISQASGDETTRKLALLQAVGWVPLYRQRMNEPRAIQLDELPPLALEHKGADQLAEVFQAIDHDRKEATGKALAYLGNPGSADRLFALARRLIFHKGADSHQYKYGAAVWEEFLRAGDPRWRAPIAAAAMAYLPGPGSPDSPLMRRARQAVSSQLGGAG